MILVIMAAKKDEFDLLKPSFVGGCDAGNEK